MNDGPWNSDNWEQTEAEDNGLECVALDPVGAANIPPRPWAYGRFLLLGSAAVIGAVDGGGKGAIAVVMALAMITGKPLLGEHVWRSGPVAIVSYEDDETEWHRRLAAACIQYGLDYATVLPSIHFIRHPRRRVSFVTLQESEILYPDGDQIIERLKGIKAALLIVDPFNHAHDLDDGNNNVMVAKVAREMSRIAQGSGAAVLVLHHLRKGSTGSPDDLMGATSLRATFRTCRILSRMDAEIAKQMNINDPWRFIRIAGSKENYAPPPEKATWFKLIGVPLGNATPEYPDGDDIGVATTWQPRAAFEGMDATVLNAVFAALKQTDHGPFKQARHTPWAGGPLVILGGRTEHEAGKIIAMWIKSSVLTKEKYYHTVSKNDVWRVTVNHAKAAEILAGLDAVSTTTD